MYRLSSSILSPILSFFELLVGGYNANKREQLSGRSSTIVKTNNNIHTVLVGRNLFEKRRRTTTTTTTTIMDISLFTSF